MDKDNSLSPEQRRRWQLARQACALVADTLPVEAADETTVVKSSPVAVASAVVAKPSRQTKHRRSWKHLRPNLRASRMLAKKLIFPVLR